MPARRSRPKPVQVGYSSHEGAESASWGDEKLQLVDGTHPVVFPGAGSHANKYTEALYVGSSADAGVGCDDTRGPHREVLPIVETIPSDPAAATRRFPWIAFQGRWGELQKAFFNGPTGPNLKTQWAEPIQWSKSWRDRSYAVPTAGVLGTGATDFFCSAVATGSRGLVSLLRNPSLTILLLGVLAVLAVFALTRTRWHPSAPLRLARRRAWGQILSAAGRMYVEHARLFLGIGLLFIPLVLVDLDRAGFGSAVRPDRHRRHRRVRGAVAVPPRRDRRRSRCLASGSFRRPRPLRCRARRRPCGRSDSGLPRPLSRSSARLFRGLVVAVSSAWH